FHVTEVQTCALPISRGPGAARHVLGHARRGARRAPEVRGRADRPDPRGAGPRARPGRSRRRRRRPPVRPADVHRDAGAARRARPPRRRAQLVGGGGMTAPAVIWHDVECGAYDTDLPLWRTLSKGLDGPVLDVGAGTGRVTLDLARRGREVIALDAEPD